MDATKLLRAVILGSAIVVVAGCWDSKEHKQEHMNKSAWADSVQAYLVDDDRAMTLIIKCLWVDGLPVSQQVAKCGPPEPGRIPPPDSLPLPTYP